MNTVPVKKKNWINWNYLLKKKALIFQRDTCNLWIDICVAIHVSFQVKIMQPPRVCHTEQYCTCLKNGSYLILEKMPNIASFKGSTNATSLRWAAITERNWSPKGHLPIENESLFTCKGYCSLWIHKVVDRDCSCQVGLRLRHHHYVFFAKYGFLQGLLFCSLK